jgi:hypothetical protein
MIFVERSERRPHRAELGIGQYYKRSGDSSIRMEHYDLEDSFKRLVVPWLEIKWEARYTGPATMGSDVKLHTVQIDILLSNPSPVTARFPFLVLRDVVGIGPQAPGSLSGLLQYPPYNGEYHFSGGADVVIHPQMSFPAVRLWTPQIRATRGLDNRFHLEQGQQVGATYRCGCYNSRHTVGELVVRAEEFIPHDG